MSRPLDDGEEGEVHPEPRRYPSGDSWAGSDRDRERGGSRQGPSHSTSSSNGRPGFAGDNRGSRDAPRDVDWIRKELQARVAALNRQGRQVDVQSLLRLVESGSSSVEPPSTRPAPRERLWDRSDNTSSRRDRSPSRLDDRFRRGGRDLSPDRDFGRGGRPYPPAQPAAPSFRGSEIHDRIASVLSTRGDSSLRDRLVSAIGSLDSARSAAGAHPRQRQSQYDAPPPPSTSYDRWDDRPRLDRQSLRAAMSPPPPARSVPPPQLHHSTRGPSIDDWRRQQRARLSEGATANTDASPFRRLRDDFDRSRRTDTPSPPSRLAPPSATRPPSQPAYDTAARGGTYNPVSSPPRPVLHSPSSSAPRAKLLTPPLAPAFQPNAQLTPGDSALPPEEDLYDVSDEDEDGPVVSTTTPAEQSAADDHESGGEDEPVKDLASEIEELSASRLFGVLEELERTERSLAEQLRGMKHDAEV